MIRRQAGQYANLLVSAGSPDSAPSVSLYAASGSLALGPINLPPVGDVEDGVFGMAMRLILSAGDYLVRYSWEESSVAKVSTELLRILPGGDPDGAYRSMTFYEPPHAGFVVGEMESGLNRFRRNPRV